VLQLQNMKALILQQRYIIDTGLDQVSVSLLIRRSGVRIPPGTPETASPTSEATWGFLICSECIKKAVWGNLGGPLQKVWQGASSFTWAQVSSMEWGE